MEEMSLGTFLDKLVSKYGPRQALVYKKQGGAKEIWTYTQLREQSDKIGSWLRGQGVGKGDRVILWADNSPRWVASYFALLRTGAVVVPLDVRSGPDFIERVVEQAEPKLAIVSDSLSVGW